MKGSLSGKTILITGSTDGLGKLVACHVAGREATVLLHGRNKEKGNSVLKEISQLTGNKNLRYYNYDYSSLTEVKKFSEELRNDIAGIDILINNAAIGSGKGKGNERELSRDGYELRFAVNYLAHVLLTERVLPSLSPYGTIVNVASVGQEPINFKDLMEEEMYDGYFAYKQSKTALIMYTFDLAERLAANGVRVNVVHPATLMNTKMVMEDWGRSRTSVEQGAQAVERLIEPKIRGKYFDGKKLSRAIAQTYDYVARERLRQITFRYLEEYL